MHHRFDFVFAQSPFQKIEVADIASNDGDLIDKIVSIQFRLRNPVAHKTDNICLSLEQSSDQPRTHKPCRTSDKHTAITPEFHVKLRIHSCLQLIPRHSNRHVTASSSFA